MAKLFLPLVVVSILSVLIVLVSAATIPRSEPNSYGDNSYAPPHSSSPPPSSTCTTTTKPLSPITFKASSTSTKPPSSPVTKPPVSPSSISKSPSSPVTKPPVSPSSISKSPSSPVTKPPTVSPSSTSKSTSEGTKPPSTTIRPPSSTCISSSSSPVSPSSSCKTPCVTTTTKLTTTISTSTVTSTTKCSGPACATTRTSTVLSTSISKTVVTSTTTICSTSVTSPNPPILDNTSKPSSPSPSSVPSSGSLRFTCPPTSAVWSANTYQSFCWDVANGTVPLPSSTDKVEVYIGSVSNGTFTTLVTACSNNFGVRACSYNVPANKFDNSKTYVLKVLDTVSSKYYAYSTLKFKG